MLLNTQWIIENVKEEMKKIPKQPSFTPKASREGRTNKNESGEKEIIKIRAEINEIETKKKK